MKFRVKALRDELAVEYIYDTATSKVWDETGSLFSFDGLIGPKFYKDVERKHLPFSRQDNPNKKVKEVELLEVFLGYKCNLNCQYCSQKPHRDSKVNHGANPAKAKEFVQLLRETGIQPRRIQIWGGEPLVYWKTFKVLVEELRALYSDDSKVWISFPTNATLLTDEIVDFCLKYHCKPIVSYDGNDDARNSKLFTDPEILRLLKRLQDADKNWPLGFGVTPSPKNCDIKAILKVFQECGFEMSSIGLHNIARCHESNDLNQRIACKFSDEELRKYSDDVFEICNERDRYKTALPPRCDSFVRSIIESLSIDTVRAECNLPFGEGLCVGLDGTVYLCHNHATVDTAQGNLRNGLESIEALGYQYWKNKKRCRECPFIHSCKGGCPSADDIANELACPNLKALHWGLFRASFAAIFGIYVTEIVPMEETDEI